MLEETLRALWRFLEFEEEEIDPDLLPVLEIGDFEIEFGSSPDETALECRARAGTLSSDPRWRHDQIIWILKHNTIFLLEGDVCVSVRSSTMAVGEEEVWFLLRVPYAKVKISELCDAFVLMQTMLETYNTYLAVGTASAEHQKKSISGLAEVPSEEDFVVFRP